MSRSDLGVGDEAQGQGVGGSLKFGIRPQLSFFVFRKNMLIGKMV